MTTTTTATATATLPPTRLEVYRDENKKFRWRLISKAEIRMQSPQSYVSKQGCLIALERAKAMMQDADLVEIYH